MKEKTVIITGASTGIGKAIAKHFLERGSNIVMNSSSQERLESTFNEFGSPSNALLVAGDISQQQTAKKIMEAAIKNFETVDILINNAGIFQPQPFLDVKEEDLDRFWAVNLKGTYFASQSAIKQMLKQNGGTIINIGTVLVDHAIGGFPATAPLVSKGAIHTLTRHLAAEFGGNNIRVNTIAPGIIRSPLQAKIGVDDADSLAGLHLLGKIGEPENIARAAYYLAEADFVTGEILNVAGGHSAGHILN